MIDIQLRRLAEECAQRIAGEVGAAVGAVVLSTVIKSLPGTVEAVLREQYPGERLRMYISKKPVTARRDRDNAIRAEWTGRNTAALAHKFKLSIQHVNRIVQAQRRGIK